MTIESTPNPKQADSAGTRAQPMPSEVRHRLSQLKAVVLLAGSLRASRLRRSIERTVLELPVDKGLRLQDVWRDTLHELSQALDVDRLAVRIMLDRSAPEPETADWPDPLRLRFERDPLDFRGTGGLIADLARAYDDHDYLLIADGAQLLTHPLIPAVAAIAQETADVAILTDMEGTPSGLTLVRCGALREVSSVGFVDLKEQALPALARSHRVQAVRWNGGIGHSVRSMDEYIAALRHWHRQHVDGPQAPASDEASPFQEDWCHSFALVEPMADVSPQAVIHDSVILSGARVEPGAVVVRSIVCPGGVVSAKSEAVETLVAQH